MFLNENATISELWAGKKEYQKTKLKSVTGRNFHSLSLRLSGEVSFVYDGKKFISSSGHITFMPKGTPYATEVREGGDMLLIHFKTVQPLKNAMPFSIDFNDNEISVLFNELVSEFKIGKENDYYSLSLMYAILAHIKKHVQYPQKKLIPKRMRFVKNFIDKNYNEEIYVYLLADVAGISEVHFRNEFKRCFGVSPLEYIKSVRINNAKRLLSTGYHTVSEVATMCGFDSISYFSYEFKRLTGKTPKEYLSEESF